MEWDYGNVPKFIVIFQSEISQHSGVVMSQDGLTTHYYRYSSMERIAFLEVELGMDQYLLNTMFSPIPNHSESFQMGMDQYL
jgi:hypothetical protein